MNDASIADYGSIQRTIAHFVSYGVSTVDASTTAVSLDNSSDVIERSKFPAPENEEKAWTKIRYSVPDVDSQDTEAEKKSAFEQPSLLPLMQTSSAHEPSKTLMLES